jgi:hypothetical protein
VNPPAEAAAPEAAEVEAVIVVAAVDLTAEVAAPMVVAEATPVDTGDNRETLSRVTLLRFWKWQRI